MTLIEHRDFDVLCDVLAPRIAEVVRASVSARGGASMALAGGATPFPLYRRLANEPLDWSRVTLVPSDERWVGRDHGASNLRAIQAAFSEARPQLGPLVPDHPGPEPSLDAGRATLARIDQPFDVCVLGMGSDGHFASLFPGEPQLRTALDPGDDESLVITRPDPLPENAPFPRVSLTLSAIAASHYLVLLLRGEQKRQVLQSAQDEDPRRCPVAALLEQTGPLLEIHWSP